MRIAAVALLAGILAGLTASAALAEGERAGDFDYYVMALSWSPNWCAREGDAEGSEQCEPGLDNGWILHGLWPQYEDGWPSFCRTTESDPSRRDTRAMADIMGTSGLAWYQWQKHGRCSGLSAADYYAASRAAYESIRRPNAFRRFAEPIRLPAQVVEDAFIQANPGLTDDMMEVTCAGEQIAELRICLTRDLEPRVCGEDVRRDCTATRALMDPIR
jgi:ribonuclease T2